MTLEVPKLDTGFQDLVDEAKRRIASLSPSWTDHNVSDPGITLVELFAYMTEHYVYRLNQVPDICYIGFLNLLSASLKPARAARGSVTFTLVPLASGKSITIKAGTEVATSGSADQQAIVFTTDRDAEARPATLAARLKSQSSPLPDFIPCSEITPAAFALGFREDLSAHALALKFENVTRMIGHASGRFTGARQSTTANSGMMWTADRLCGTKKRSKPHCICPTTVKKRRYKISRPTLGCVSTGREHLAEVPAGQRANRGNQVASDACTGDRK